MHKFGGFIIESNGMARYIYGSIIIREGDRKKFLLGADFTEKLIYEMIEKQSGKSVDNLTADDFYTVTESFWRKNGLEIVTKNGHGYAAENGMMPVDHRTFEKEVRGKIDLGETVLLPDNLVKEVVKLADYFEEHH